LRNFESRSLVAAGPELAHEKIVEGVML